MRQQRRRRCQVRSGYRRHSRDRRERPGNRAGHVFFLGRRRADGRRRGRARTAAPPHPPGKAPSVGVFSDCRPGAGAAGDFGAGDARVVGGAGRLRRDRFVALRRRLGFLGRRAVGRFLAGVEQARHQVERAQHDQDHAHRHQHRAHAVAPSGGSRLRPRRLAGGGRRAGFSPRAGSRYWPPGRRGGRRR